MLLRFHGGGLGPEASMIVCAILGVFIILISYASYMDKLNAKRDLSFARSYLISNLWSTQADHKSKSIVFMKARSSDKIAVVMDESLKAIVLVNNNGQYTKTEKVTINQETLSYMVIVCKHAFKMADA